MIKWPLIARRVEGHSMEPTLSPGQIIYATPLIIPWKGDIVVARHEGKDIIKRVSQVSPNHLLLVGDNTSDSHDSRVFGEISKKDILGKVVGIKGD